MIHLFNNVTIRLAGITEESVVDGTGIRFTVFTQGCPHRCKGCHNPATHDFSGGNVYKLSDLAEKYKKNPLLDGITFSGGEPFCYPVECALLAEFVRSSGGNVWAYSGYTYEELTELAKENPAVKDFLDKTDVLVDGRFVESQKNLKLKFRGSENQRMIDLKTMRQKESAEIILLF